MDERKIVCDLVQNVRYYTDETGRMSRLMQAAVNMEGAFKDFYAQLLQDPLRPNELINVPTDSLFIEALPGEHPLLGDFQALHRAVDVKKVQVDVRELELENIRYAARVLSGERGDPDVDKRVIIEGPGVTVNPEID
jgi:hypothetical protein